MNQKIYEFAGKILVNEKQYFVGDPKDWTYIFTHSELAKFAELIVQECMAQCEQVAADADAMTQSKFVTDAGRMLHEGVWGGAKQCSGQIRKHFFGVEE